MKIADVHQAQLPDSEREALQAFLPPPYNKSLEVIFGPTLNSSCLGIERVLAENQCSNPRLSIEVIKGLLANQHRKSRVSRFQ